jgi:hypothetical protein
VQLCPLQLCQELFQTLARIKGPGARRALGGEKVRRSLAIAITATSWRRSRSVGEGSAAQRKSAPSLQRIYLGGAVCPAIGPPTVATAQTPNRRRDRRPIAPPPFGPVATAGWLLATLRATAWVARRCVPRRSKPHAATAPPPLSRPTPPSGIGAAARGTLPTAGVSSPNCGLITIPVGAKASCVFERLSSRPASSGGWVSGLPAPPAPPGARPKPASPN